MSLDINIETIDEEDYDGNPEQIKVAVVALDGVVLPVQYSFEATRTEAEIRTSIEADLTEKEYTF